MDSWTAVVGGDDTSDEVEDEVGSVSDVDVDVEIEVSNHVVLSVTAWELLLLVVTPVSALLVTAAAAALVVLHGVGVESIQVGLTAYWLPQVGHLPSGASWPY